MLFFDQNWFQFRSFCHLRTQGLEMHKCGICGPSGCYSSEFLEINRSRSGLAKSDHFGPHWTWSGKVTFWSKSHCVWSDRGSKKVRFWGQNSGWRILVNFQSIFSLPLKRFNRELDLSILTHQSWGREVGGSTFTAVHFLPAGGGGCIFWTPFPTGT